MVGAITKKCKGSARECGQFGQFGRSCVFWALGLVTSVQGDTDQKTPTGLEQTKQLNRESGVPEGENNCK